MNGYAETRRKKSFMSFRLPKKLGKTKDKESNLEKDHNGKIISEEDGNENSLEPIINGSSSVKPKKKYLTRMSSFVSKVASKVQVNNVGEKTINTNNSTNKDVIKSDNTSAQIVPCDTCPKTEPYLIFNEKIPSVIGIRNHGNTCFINAIVQCLNHTDILAEYFVLDQYKQDLARCNKLNSKKYGTKGEITEHLAVLLKALWTLRYVPEISLNLKNVVDKYEPSYRGSNQHDAAEFLMFVLDKVHEDLNTASKRKYKKIKVWFVKLKSYNILLPM